MKECEKASKRAAAAFAAPSETPKEGINFTPHYTHHATTPLTLRTRLLLLGEIDSLSLEHVKESLGTLENLHVGSLGLLDCLVVFVSCLGLAGEGLVDLGGRSVRMERSFWILAFSSSSFRMCLLTSSRFSR